MILNDIELRKLASNIFPFDFQYINPASIDLRLGNTIRVPRWYWQPALWRLAYRLGWPRWTDDIEFNIYLLKPRQFVLCSSLEITRIPDDMIAILFSKSSTSRRGIEHLHGMAILDLGTTNGAGQIGRGSC